MTFASPRAPWAGYSNIFVGKGSAALATRLGSPHYLAPEIVRGETYGAGVDIWSLGVVLFVSLCGCFPFGGGSIESIFDKVLHAPIVFPKTLTPEVGCRAPTPAPAHARARQPRLCAAGRAQACNLMERMMERDRRKRATLDEIRTHAWTNVGFHDAPRRHRRPTLADYNVGGATRR